MRSRCFVLAALAATSALASGAAGAPTSGGRLDSYPAPPSTLRAGQHPYSSSVRLPGGESVRMDYMLYAPAAAARDRTHRWPLIVFLHGSGEKGTDLHLLLRQPLPRTLATTTAFPAIVVSPQLPPEIASWSDRIEPLDALVRSLERRYPVDPKRLYLTGLSLGGFGTWHYALARPRRFAAIVPIAGGYIQGSRAVPSNICALRTLPTWAFHGSADTIVEPSQSQVLVEALRACGSKVARLTLYRGVDHFGSWTRAYSSRALWRWLFAQHRG
jgi:predicted peptidase